MSTLRGDDGERFDPGECAARLPDDRYFVALKRDGLEVGFYAPQDADPQQPHDRDECYVIVEGEGRFQLGETTVVPFAPGDLLFVPAGVPHRFLDFGTSLKAWVVFIGTRKADRPTSGESRSPESI